jgi:hypothetical protein
VQRTNELVGKRFELLREIVPDLRQIAVTGYALSPGFPLEVDAAKAAAPSLGLDVVVRGLRQTGDFAPTLNFSRRRRRDQGASGDMRRRDRRAAAGAGAGQCGVCRNRQAHPQPAA